MKITVFPTKEAKEKPADEQHLGFGALFTDHMFVAEYDEGQGWHDLRIQPYQQFCLDPASPVFHYGQTVFEGLKAYRAKGSGEIHLFRAIDNMRRLNRSAARLCMPELDPKVQLAALEQLVDLERDWVPQADGTSLYLRPTMIADGTGLGAHAAQRYLYFIICSPSGVYFKDGLAPVRIYIEDYYVRAVQGGMGFAKAGGNYAVSFLAAAKAETQGFDQVLWLDGRENKYVEEVGAMNIMFVIDGKLVTSTLGDSVLPGLTRDSVLTLAKEMGMAVEERRISVAELFKAHEAGLLQEAFGTGTAAVISPVGMMSYQSREMIINNNQVGPIAQKFYDQLTGIQLGTIPDAHGWVTTVPHG